MLLGLQHVSIRNLRHEKWLKAEMRVRINTRKVRQYASEKKNGAKFPPPVVFVDADGIYWTGDGFHRIQAEDKNGKTSVECNLKAGTLKDAILWNLKANREANGMPFSYGDFTKAVTTILMSPLFKDWNRAKVAEHVGCTLGLVSKIALHKLGLPKSKKAAKDSPTAVDPSTIAEMRANGNNCSQIAKELSITRATAQRIGAASPLLIDCPHCKGSGKILKEKP